MSATPWEIRPALVDDCLVIARFNCCLAEETEGKSLNPDTIHAGVRALLLDPRHGSYFVAVEAGVVIGQIMHTREWSDWRNGEIWWLQSVYVHPDFRGRGVFSSLQRHVESLARSTVGVVGLRLYVETQNLRAQEAYRRLGFKDAHYAVMERLFETRE